MRLTDGGSYSVCMSYKCSSVMRTEKDSGRAKADQTELRKRGGVKISTWLIDRGLICIFLFLP